MGAHNKRIIAHLAFVALKARVVLSAYTNEISFFDVSYVFTDLDGNSDNLHENEKSRLAKSPTLSTGLTDITLFMANYLRVRYISPSWIARRRHRR